jgi:hypothetical protein
MFGSIKDASIRILVHMLAIANEGISSRTPTISEKYRLYRKFT